MTPSSPVLAVERIGKTFRLYPSAAARLSEKLLGGIRHREHTALDGITFALHPGETLGLLGRNGAGKSTLLKLVLGVLAPDTGTVAHRGRLTGLLELGTGFDPMLTGRENIYINGQLLGLPVEEIRRKEAEIIEFAELGAYIDEPVRTYSTGMGMRLGFSVAIHADPSCFVIDEALAVGDARFQQKCFDRIRQFREKGGAILFVSHDLNAVRLLCSRAIVLNEGRVAFDGDPEAAGRYYYRLLSGETLGEENCGVPGWGNKQVRIKHVGFVDADDEAQRAVTAGQVARLCIDVEADIDKVLTVGFMIRDRFGQELFGTNTALLGQSIHFCARESSRVFFDLPIYLGPATYTLSVALHTGLDHLDDCEHWWDFAYEFEVTGFEGYPYVGTVCLPVQAIGQMPLALPPS